MEENKNFETTGVPKIGLLKFPTILFWISWVLFILSIGARGNTVGPFYLYLPIVIAFLIYFKQFKEKNKIELVITYYNVNEFTVSISGKKSENNLNFKMDNYTYWYNVIPTLPRTGFPYPILFFQGTNSDQEKLCLIEKRPFRPQLKNWKQTYDGFPVEQKTFSIDNLSGLVNWLEQKKDSN